MLSVVILCIIMPTVVVLKIIIDYNVCCLQNSSLFRDSMGKKGRHDIQYNNTQHNNK
jgi:hypothetical protein